LILYNLILKLILKIKIYLIKIGMRGKSDKVKRNFNFNKWKIKSNKRMKPYNQKLKFFEFDSPGFGQSLMFKK